MEARSGMAARENACCLSQGAGSTGRLASSLWISAVLLISIGPLLTGCAGHAPGVSWNGSIDRRPPTGMLPHRSPDGGAVVCAADRHSRVLPPQLEREHWYLDPQILVQPAVVKASSAGAMAPEVVVFLLDSPYGHHSSYWVLVEPEAITLFFVVAHQHPKEASTALSRLDNGMSYVEIPATRGRPVFVSDGVNAVRAESRLDLSLEHVRHPWREHPDMDGGYWEDEPL